MAEKGKRVRHYCPPIPAGWNIKVTGPSSHEGESMDAAAQKWLAYCRLIERHVRPMPRVTTGVPRSKDGKKIKKK